MSKMWEGKISAHILKATRSEPVTADSLFQVFALGFRQRRVYTNHGLNCPHVSRMPKLPQFGDPQPPVVYVGAADGAIAGDGHDC